MSSPSSNDDAEEGEDYAEFNQEYFAQIFEHEKMISDSRRMDFYHKIIQANVSPSSAAVSTAASVPVPIVKSPLVLDIGTGTGVLACLSLSLSIYKPHTKT